MRFVLRIAGLLLVTVLLAPASSDAQFHGLGRIAGTVTDDGGSPLKAVNIRATMQGSDGVIEASTDEKGAWAVTGMGKGEWHVTFQVAGYTPTAAKINLTAELARIPPITIVLKKVKGA